MWHNSSKKKPQVKPHKDEAQLYLLCTLDVPHVLLYHCNWSLLLCTVRIETILFKVCTLRHSKQKNKRAAGPTGVGLFLIYSFNSPTCLLFLINLKVLNYSAALFSWIFINILFIFVFIILVSQIQIFAKT